MKAYRAHLAVYLGLLALLGATYFAAKAELGAWNGPLALSIAAVKAALVAVFFMQLSHAKGMPRVFALAGVFWLTLLLTFVLIETSSRSWL